MISRERAKSGAAQRKPPVADGGEEPSRLEGSCVAGKASAAAASAGCEGWTCVREASLGGIPRGSCLELPEASCERWRSCRWEYSKNQ